MKPITARAGFMLAVLAWPGLVAAQVHTAASVRAPAVQGAGLCQFLLHHYTLPPQTEAQLNQVVGQALIQHRNAFGFGVDTDFHVRIRLFGQLESYLQFVRADTQAAELVHGSLSLTNLAGYYSPATGELVTWRQTVPSDLANVILHESSHAILHAHFHRLPVWLMEGCATYFAFPHELQDQHDVRSIEARWGLLNRWLRETNLPPVAAFVNLDRPAWLRLSPARSYTISWSIFQFLMSTPQNRQVLQQFAWGLEREPKPEPNCAALLDQLYPGGLDKFEADWHRWIQQTGAKVLDQAAPGRAAR